MGNGQNGQSGHKSKNEIMTKNGQWTEWTQIQNKIVSQMANGQNGQNGESGHKFKIKS